MIWTSNSSFLFCLLLVLFSLQAMKFAKVKSEIKIRITKTYKTYTQRSQRSQRSQIKVLKAHFGHIFLYLSNEAFGLLHVHEIKGDATLGKQSSARGRRCFDRFGKFFPMFPVFFFPMFSQGFSFRFSWFCGILSSKRAVFNQLCGL